MYIEYDAILNEEKFNAEMIKELLSNKEFANAKCKYGESVMQREMNCCQIEDLSAHLCMHWPSCD